MLSTFPDLPVFRLVSEIGKDLQTPCYVIGGYVRDYFLRRTCKDIDVVCCGSGIAVAEELALRLGKKGKVHVFKNFGTAQLALDDMELEFVGARKESYSPHSRKPDVATGTLEDDQNRRDFTINAMAFSLNEENYGHLIDPFGGILDLDRRIIRTPLDPELTFSDDPLRMMRAIRFASQLNFTIESACFQSIKKQKNRIEIVSKERVADELNKIVLSPKPSVGFRLLFDSGLLKIIFPEMHQLQGVEVKNGKAHKDNFYHTLQVLDNLSANTDNLWLRWSAILHDIAKPLTKRLEPSGWTFHGHEDKGARMVPGIFNRLKLPLNEKMKYVQKLVLLHLRPIVLSKEVVTDSAVRRLLFEAGDDIDDLMMLCEADITSKNEAKVKKYLANFQLVRQKLRQVEEKDQVRNWQPPVSGEDIMHYFSIQPCREVGIIKNSIREAILEGEIGNNREEAWQFMIAEGQKLGLVSPQT